MRRAARVDRNQAEIVQAMRAMGAVVLIISQLKNCCDVIAFYRGKIYPIEIKDGQKPPSQQKLTEGEAIFKDKIEAVGCTYHIIRSIEEAIICISDKK